MKIFDVINNKVIIDPEVRLIKYFKKIIERDRGSKGDNDGRKKYKAMKELAYIYHMADNKSVFSNLPDNIKEKEIILDLDLDNWKPDEVIKEAISKYKSYKETVSERTLKELKRTLESAIDMLQIVRNSIEEKIKEIQSNEGNIGEALKQLVELFKICLEMSNKLPIAIDDIIKLQITIKKEESVEPGNIRGGGEVGLFED